MWNLPGPGLEPVSRYTGRRILNHCATKEVQPVCFWKMNEGRLKEFILNSRLLGQIWLCGYFVWLIIGALFKNWDSSHNLDFQHLGKSQNISHMRHTFLHGCLPSANQQLPPLEDVYAPPTAPVFSYLNPSLLGVSCLAPVGMEFATLTVFLYI